MCEIRCINKKGKVVTKNISDSPNQRDRKAVAITTPSQSAGIHVSYRRYGTMIYPQVKG